MQSEDLCTIAETTGLEINSGNTKGLRINANQDAPILLGVQAIEDVNKFTYIGSIVSKAGGTEEDIKAWIAKARHAFITLKVVWRNKNIRLKAKLQLFNSNVKSVLPYRTDTWRHTKNLEHKLQVFINTCL